MRRLAAIAAGAALLAACGRSAPDGPEALGEDGTAAEPSRAGIQVVSDNPVVAAVPTTAPPSTTTTPTSAMAAESTAYVVQPGDTLSAIADRFGVSVDAISQANSMTDVNDIKPGQELVIPTAG